MKLHLYLFLLLADLSVGLASTADTDETIDSDVERMMAKRRRKRKKGNNNADKTSDDDVTLFTRSYLTIAGRQVTAVTADGVVEENKLGSLSFALGKSGDSIFSSNEQNFLVRGSSFLQSGPIYNPDDVKFIDCVKQPNKDSCKNGLSESDNSGGLGVDAGNGPLRYGGGKQPNVIELRPPKQNYFFNGECTTVAGFGLSQILAHSCFYNLCLGGLGEDCVNIFAGGGFIFDPLAVVLPNEEPLLPPSFPGAVIGGTGKYQGIKGSAQIVTITSRTSSSFSVPTIGSVAKPLGLGVEQTGYITQLIQLETTQQLPPSKTQDADN